MGKVTESNEKPNNGFEQLRQKEAHVKEVTCMDLPLDWNNVFNSDVRSRGVHVDNIPDALVLSLSTLGRVDIEYISSITGANYKTVISTLKGSIYQNPETWNECFYRGWETADEYLSGNLVRKLKVATAANKEYNCYFADNVRALNKLLPPLISAKDIYITLGSPWVPPDIIDDFITHLFGDCERYANYVIHKIVAADWLDTQYDSITGAWYIPEKSRYRHNINVTQTYGTPQLEALHILEKTLNMKSVEIYDEVASNVTASGKKRVLNEAETTMALEKQQKMVKEFQRWVWTDPERRRRLEKIYEEKYGCIRRRVFDGSFLQFPGMSSAVSLFPYQKDAVARIIFTPNTLLAHDVGAGKTYVMIAAGQELKRMGLSSKNLYVVPNNIVGQWHDIFRSMYPDADLLIVDPKTFSPGKRNALLKRMRDLEFDGIIMAYSCFDQIPLSNKYYVEDLEQQVKLITEQGNSVSPRLRNKLKTINKTLSDLRENGKDGSGVICFDELGITRLFIDEAHNFKNVPIDTQMADVLGINSVGSKRCLDVLNKVRLVQKQNNGKGVVLATGTPITNSITDVFVMQQYLQSGELALLSLQNFDSWVGMFAERTTGFEIDVDTNSFRIATRFSKFHNLTELTALLATVADFHSLDGAAGIPRFDGYTDSVISKTSGLKAYLDDISVRADNVRKGNVDLKTDNMLKITTDGRKAALDLRLVDSSAGFSYQSKVARCAENVAGLYFRTENDKSTQLIFCDTSTPKADFNIYTELRYRLSRFGVPPEQIAFVHDAGTEAKREVLFSKVRNGEIRILIGSTFKLGLGVNIQDKLIALHHIDIPWRPADMVQREGRILRQGNTNEKVYIFRYITEGSFDAYSWQLLETKQKFICELLSGSLSDRSGNDIDDTVLNYAEVKALAIGNPLVKERVETANELARYKALQRKLVESRLNLEKELLELPARIKAQRNDIELCRADLAFYRDRQSREQRTADTATKKDYQDKRRQLRETIGRALRDHILETKEKPLMSYRGFTIILPANMSIMHPYVWLERNGRYYVELGDTDVGNLVRIDNYLDCFEQHLAEMSAELTRLENKERDIKAELRKDESYSDQIELYKKKLEDIDKKLGVEPK